MIEKNILFIMAMQRLFLGLRFSKLVLMLSIFFLGTLYVHGDGLVCSSTNMLCATDVDTAENNSGISSNNECLHLESKRVNDCSDNINDFAGSKVNGSQSISKVESLNNQEKKKSESLSIIDFIPLLCSSLLTFLAFWCRSFFKFLHNRKITRMVIKAIHSDVRNGLAILEEVVKKESEISGKLLPSLNWERYCSRIDGNVLSVLQSDTILEDEKIKSCKLKCDDWLQHLNNYFSYICVAVNTMLREIRSTVSVNSDDTIPIQRLNGLSTIVIPTIELSGMTLPDKAVDETQYKSSSQHGNQIIDFPELTNLIGMKVLDEGSIKENFYKYINYYYDATMNVFLMNEAIIESLNKKCWFGMFFRWIKGLFICKCIGQLCNMMKMILVFVFTLCTSISFAYQTWEDPITGIRWNYNDVSGGVEITGGQKPNYTYYAAIEDQTISGELKVPSLIDGKQVVSVGVRAFWNCSNLTSIIIPEGVTKIAEVSPTYPGTFLFSGCSSLEKVVLPKSLSACTINFTVANSVDTFDTLVAYGDVVDFGSVELKEVYYMSRFMIGLHFLLKTIGESNGKKEQNTV